MFQHNSHLDLQQVDEPLVVLTSCWRARGHREKISFVLQPGIPGFNYLNNNDMGLIPEKKDFAGSEDSIE